MKIILVRHGETIGNRNRMFEHPLRGNLSKKGIDQSKKAGKWLKNEKFDVIYVSPSRRTKDTAKYILSHHKDTKVISEKRIIERNPGACIGKRMETKNVLLQDCTNQAYEFRPENGESVKDLHIRAGKFAKALLRKENGKDILIISHGGFIRHFIMNLLGRHPKTWKRYLHQNTGITTISIGSNGKPRLIKLNSTKHLE